MFIDFNKVFNKESQKGKKIPDAVIKHLNNSVPPGTKYIADESGNCHITYDGESISVGGIVPKPTDKHKEVLGENYSLDDVLLYAYNSQNRIPLELKKEGIIIINGQEFPIEKVSYNPLSPVNYISGSAFMIPQKFPKPFKFKIGCSKYSIELNVRRIPNESVKTAAFESEKNKVLYIKYFVNEEESKLSFNISFDLSYAKTIREIIEATSIYNAFLDGEGNIFGKNLPTKLKSDGSKHYDNDSIEFWERVLKIEELLNIQFSPPKKEVVSADIICVESLYQNLVEGQPIRVYKNIESIDGEWNFADNRDIQEELGKPIFFEFKANSKDFLFGEEINLPCVVGIFNAKIIAYSIKDKKYSLKLDNESEEKRMFTSTLKFLSNEELETFMKIDGNKRIQLLHDAKSIEEILNKY